MGQSTLCGAGRAVGPFTYLIRSDTKRGRRERALSTRFGGVEAPYETSVC
jgi:hypothetical protein